METRRGAQPAASEPWPYNPLVTLVRLHGTEVIAETIDRYLDDHGFQLSHFDLAVQVMIVSCSYDPEEIWLAGPQGQNGDDVAIAAELVAKGAAREAGDVMEYALSHGQLRLNDDLIREIASDQAVRLHRLHEAQREQFDLPVPSDPVRAPFPRGAELMALRVGAPTGPGGGTYEMHATERVSATKVVFRPIGLDVSRAYVESFHYLHAARDDDSLAFGAFVAGEQLPFAIVTYAAVHRRYKHTMLRAVGLDPTTTLELTRAWSTEFSPKNTMSMLFAYAHAYILRRNLPTPERATQSIITAVNPNLGFKGSAFRAVGFGVIGLKPATFHYVVDGRGRRTYVPRRALPSTPSTTPERSTTSPTGRPHVMTARLPLLPTKELAVVLSGSRRSRPVTDAVYRVSEAEYRREMAGVRSA